MLLNFMKFALSKVSRQIKVLLFLWTVEPHHSSSCNWRFKRSGQTQSEDGKNFGGKGLELPGTSFTISHMGSNF